MNLNDVLLKVMHQRQEYDKYSGIIKSKNVVSPHVQRTIINAGEWFNENPECSEVNPEQFLVWCKLAHKFQEPEYEQITRDHLRIMQEQNVPESIKDGLYDRLSCEIRSIEIQELLERYRQGKPVDFFAELRGHVDLLETELRRKTLIQPVNTSIELLLQQHVEQFGIKWRLPALNRCMRPLQPGDFGIIAARPDTGKTSFMADQLTYMASQLAEGCPVIWFNNEGPGDKIRLRCYQAALNATRDELALKVAGHVLHTEYAAATGGSDQLQIYDVHDLFSYDIETIIKNNNPGIVVFDMIDNIKFAGTNHLGGTRTDQLLETMYQWARNLAVKYDCIVLATSQVSAEGETVQKDGKLSPIMRYPMLSMLKDSKTGKQGASDFVLMIGRDQNKSDARYISLPKNKLALDGRKDPKCEVYFDGSRSRYNEEPPRMKDFDYDDRGI